MVPGRLLAEDVVGLRSAKTAQGQEVTISLKGGEAMVDNARIVQTDIVASNGVIHVIDSVILPKADE